MIHHVFANRSNIGDWLSARAVQRLLGTTAVVEHLCDDPFVPETLARLGAARPGDFVVIGGGGLFMDYFEPFWTGFEAIARRVPFAIWGVGCCDRTRMETRPDWPRLAAIVAASRLCLVRDELTRRYLAPCDLVPAAACPSVTAIRTRRRGWGVLHVDSFDAVGADVYEYMTAAARRFAAQSDRPFRRTNNLIPPGSEEALAATLGLYAGSDVIVSSRLHGCIIGLAMGRSVIAVSGDRKVDAFMCDAGLADWVLNVSNVERLPELLHAASMQPSPRAYLARVRREHRALAARFDEVVRGVNVAVA